MASYQLIWERLYLSIILGQAKRNFGLKLQPLHRRIFWILMVLMGIIILVLNDVFGERDAFIVISLLYFILLAISAVIWTFRQARIILELRREKNKTELMHLRSQVNPHFFFNMLNNLYGWTEKDPKVAQQLILKLSEMMRYSIYQGEEDTVPIEDEIAYLDNYVELHQMRYHKEIEVIFVKAIAEKGIRIMPLLFINLLENAFKHGVENLREGAYVHMRLAAVTKKVEFEITNNFESDNSGQEEGIGIKNLKRRLELAYPKKHTFEINKKDKEFQVKMSISL